MERIKREATTVYLNPRIARAAKVRAALSDRSLSDLVNDSLVKCLHEDESDLALIRARKKGHVRSYDDFIKELKKDGLI